MSLVALVAVGVSRNVRARRGHVVAVGDHRGARAPLLPRSGWGAWRAPRVAVVLPGLLGES